MAVEHTAADIAAGVALTKVAVATRAARRVAMANCMFAVEEILTERVEEL